MGHQQDLIRDISMAWPAQADTLGNFGSCSIDGVIVVFIGAHRRMLRWRAGRNQPVRTVTSGADCFLSGRARHLACSILLLVFGPGCEALMFAGLFDPAVEWLACSLARAASAPALAPALSLVSSLDRRSAAPAHCGFQVSQSSNPGW